MKIEQTNGCCCFSHFLVQWVHSYPTSLAFSNQPRYRSHSLFSVVFPHIVPAQKWECRCYCVHHLNVAASLSWSCSETAVLPPASNVSEMNHRSHVQKNKTKRHDQNFRHDVLVGGKIMLLLLIILFEMLKVIQVSESISIGEQFKTTGNKECWSLTHTPTSKQTKTLKRIKLIPYEFALCCNQLIH